MAAPEDSPSEPTTMLDRPAERAEQPPVRGSSRNINTPPTSSVIVAGEHTLAEVEAERMRGLMTGISASSAIVAVLVIFLGGDPIAARVHAGALVATAVAAGGCAVWFHQQLAKWIVIAQIVVLLSGYYFWGVFSAYCALVPLTLYIAAGVASKNEALYGTIFLVLTQFTYGMLTVLGYLEPRSLVEPVLGRTPLSTQIAALSLIQLITIGAMVAGRAARKTSIDVLDAHNKALLELAKREAQLAEAYADARAAHEAGLGGVGRFTEQTIDQWKLGEVLGRGAMGEVYAAHKPGDDTPLAMKILAPHLLRDTSSRERFLRESAIVSALTSKHVVRVVEVAPPDALLPYIVMERLDGVDLAQLLKKQPILPPSEVLEIVRHVASGLDAAHKAGIVHRDLKPSNIYATGQGGTRIWKLLDFGASKWRDDGGTLTQDKIVGTPGYMAPEQALGRAVDHRSDVYAFGILLYRLVTGVPAVVPGEVPAMLQEVSYRMPMQPSKRARVSPEIEAVLAVAIAKQPALRFATAGELAHAFETALDGKLDRGIQLRADSTLADHPWGRWQRA